MININNNNNNLIEYGGTQCKNSTASITGIDASLAQLASLSIDTTPSLSQPATLKNHLDRARQVYKNKQVTAFSSARCTREVMEDKMLNRENISIHSDSRSIASQSSSNARRRVAQKQAPNFVSPLVAEASEEPPKTLVVVNSIGNELVYMDYSDQKNPVLASYTVLLQLKEVKHGVVMMNVVRDNLGYYITHGLKGVPMLASSVFALRSMNQTFEDVGYTDQRQHYIFVPLYKELVHLFKAHREDTAIKSAHQQAIKNVVSTFKHKIRMPLTQQCVDAFAAICDYTEAYYRLSVQIANYSTKAQNNMRLPGIVTELTSDVVRTGCPQVKTCTDIPPDKVPQRFPIKWGTTIIQRGLSRMLTEEEWFDDPPVNVQYTPVTDDIPAAGTATHQWCRLSKSTRYAKTTWNQYHAMQRIFKARDGEHAFQISQLKLTLALMHTFPTFKHHLSTMGVKLGQVDRPPEADPWEPGFYSVIVKYPTLPEVPEYTYADVRDICETYKPLTTFYYNWSCKMVNTIGEALVDFSYNASSYVRYTAYTFWQSCQIPLLWRTEWSALPSPKQLERQRMVQGTILEANVQVAVVISVKDEIAKNSGNTPKMPRLFTSYGIGCCVAPGLPDVAKKHMNGWYMFNIGDLKVCLIAYTLPKTTELELLFNELIHATNRTDNYLCVAFYSDDSCYAGCVGGVRFGYNVDISSCDASNGVPIFYATTAMLSGLDSELAAKLLEQCCQPLRFNVKEDPHKNFKIKPPGVFEGSGTVLTTVLNHNASVGNAICTGIQIARLLGIGSPIDVARAIEFGASMVGHKVTVSSIEVDGVLEPSKFQFLKYSPMLAKGKDGVERYIPARNSGSIVKGFGQLKEAMQARQIGVDSATFSMMTMSEKFTKFLSGVVAGYCNEAETPLLAALRTRFPLKETKIDTDFILVQPDGCYSDMVISGASLRARYGIDDFSDMVRILLDLQVGDIVTDYALETFMVVDYEAAYTQYETSTSCYV